MVISPEFARAFATDWVEAWNACDFEAVLSHYTDDFEMSSPYIAQIAGEPSGRLVGKASVRAYWSSALQRMPALRFELPQVLKGADSVTTCYRGARGLAAEAFFFNALDLVVKACAHYEQQCLSRPWTGHVRAANSGNARRPASGA
jgi:SnoaL-like domain